MATKYFSAVVEDPTADLPLKTMNAALLASAEGDWEKASQGFKQILDGEPDNFLVSENLLPSLRHRLMLSRCRS